MIPIISKRYCMKNSVCRKKTFLILLTHLNDVDGSLSLSLGCDDIRKILHGIPVCRWVCAKFTEKLRRTLQIALALAM